MIPGTFIGSQAQSGPIGLYRATYGTSDNIGSFTVTNADLGNPSSDRVIVAVLNYWEFDTTVGVSSFTVGGVSMTNRVVLGNLVSGGTGSYVYAAIWSAIVPSGATGTISVAFTRGIERGCQFGIWSLYNLANAAPFATTSAATGSVNPANLTANVQPNDFGIVGASGVYGSASFSYTNATERYDVLSPDFARSGADFQATAVQSPRTVTITPSGVTSGSAFVMAVWR
jgi:hypothetical protein